MTLLEEEGLPVFDTVSGKIVGRLIEETGSAILLEYAGLLSFSVNPLNGGEKFELKATIQNPTFVGARYALMKAGIRGVAIHTEAWLQELWVKYAASVKSGNYTLHVPKEGVVVQQGDGVSVGEEMSIGVEGASPPKPEEGASAGTA